MAARTRKGTKDAPWPESVREKIRTSMLVNRLLDHALGNVDMSSTQVQSAKILIDKVLPSLQHSENTNTMDISDVFADILTALDNKARNELANRISERDKQSPTVYN
ncbi:MAG: hypothetical protein OER56_01685 [Hyphomicrobiales bacterium]|nr:hypothetical protein [Hyphomicrobiales bacterium]